MAGMNARGPGSRRLPPWPLTASLLLAGAACAGREAEAPRPPAPAAPAPAAPGAMRVYRDPATGAFVEPPPGTPMPGPPRAPAAPAPLTEEAAPNGGRMIRLRGAFRSQMVGHAGADGATVSCATTAGAPAAAPPPAPSPSRAPSP
jgi:hypothetical protein